MVATLSKLTDAGAAAAYYKAGDDYYTQGSKAPSRWHGSGAEPLGLHGEFAPDTFTAMLDGTLPDGTLLGTTRGGAREHKPGWDLTLSAPKSVSVLALVAGDRRLLDAQDRAASITFDYAERHAVVTRIRQGKEVERVATDNLVIAAFPHVTARATDDLPAPQLHTHGVVFNMTQGPDGTWRSIESRDLYRLQKELGGIYHQALAAEIVQLGYTVSFAPGGTFEVDGVPLDVRQGFSGRSAQIEAALDARGQSRATATAAQKAVVALDTRAPKQAVDQRQLVTGWRTRADELGFTEEVRRTLVADAEARAAGLPVATPRQRRLTDDQAVAFAGQHLAERLNGETAEVVAIDPLGSRMVVEREDGRRDMLDLAHLADRHLRPGWVRTIHSSQGTTCDRVMSHLESFRANTVDAASVYVAISRAKTSAAVYTDSRASLIEALGLRDEAQVGATDRAITQVDEAFS